MSKIALGVSFAAEETKALQALQENLIKQQGIFSANEVLYLNIASWQFPSRDESNSILDAMHDVQQMTVSVFPIIDLHSQPALACLQVINTHILTNWHFDIHKRFELPYLGLYEQDMPKRWRPLIHIGSAGSSDVLHDATWPKELHCNEALLIDKDTDEIIGRQPLQENDAIIW